jgi:hypothetical protein
VRCLASVADGGGWPAWKRNFSEIGNREHGRFLASALPIFIGIWYTKIQQHAALIKAIEMEFISNPRREVPVCGSDGRA